MRFALKVWLVVLLVASAGCAQAPKVAEAIAHLKSGEVQSDDVNAVVGAQAAEAIPVLQARFASAEFPDTKARLAIALVKLGDKNGAAWDFLLKNATAVVESNPPFPMSHVGSPDGGKQGFSPEFVAWAKEHKMDEGEAVVYAGVEAQTAILELGATGDARAVPVLRRALNCRGPIVQASAAKGLAKIGDQEAVPLMLTACKRGPQDAARLIAVSLVYFDSAEAQTGVDLYLSKEEARRAREDRAKGVGPFGEKL